MTVRGGSSSRSLRRRREVSTSTSPFRASELIGIGAGRPISLATIGLTVFFPVPGVPQTPIMPRTPGRPSPGVKGLLWLGGLQHLQVLLLQLGDLGADDEQAVGLKRVLPVVVLVVILCLVERFERLQLGDGLRVPDACGVYLPDDVFGRLLL